MTTGARIPKMRPADELRNSLPHVLWIGKGTDAGKTRVAEITAARHVLSTNHYDRRDAPQVEILAQSIPHYMKHLYP